jgi:hypothetical protein
MKIHSLGGELLHAYRCTEGQTTDRQNMMKTTVTIHNSVNTLKIMSLWLFRITHTCSFRYESGNTSRLRMPINWTLTKQRIFQNFQQWNFTDSPNWFAPAATKCQVSQHYLPGCFSTIHLKWKYSYLFSYAKCMELPII